MRCWHKCKSSTTTSGLVGGFKLQSFLKANHLKYEEMIKRITQETDAANVNNAVLSTADKKLSSSLYYVLWSADDRREQVAQDSTHCGSRGRRDRCSQVVGGVSARHRQSSLGSADVNNELVDPSEQIQSLQSTSWI